MSKRHGGTAHSIRAGRSGAFALPPGRFPAASRSDLDWHAFSGRYLSGRGRHDLEAVSAYDAYNHGRRWRKSSRPKRKRSIAPNEPVLTTVGGAPRVGRASLGRPGATR